MSFKDVKAGSNPDAINVIIEIPQNSTPIKYEVDKDTDVVWVDRLQSTSMYYPANYGYVNNTLADDGDPIDVLVITPHPLIVGSVIPARVIGVLKMSDDGGQDEKIIAVPADKLSVIYREIKSVTDIPLIKEQIEHFFSHYKDLEVGKWTKIEGWGDAKEAEGLINKAASNYKG